MATTKDASPDLEKTVSRHSQAHPPPELLASDADAELLGKSLNNSAVDLTDSHLSKARLQTRTA